MKSYSAYNIGAQNFNKYERIAGVFVLLALLGFVFISALAVVNKGWFFSKINYSSHLQNAAGIYSGTPINAMGVRMGWVSEVQIIGQDDVLIKFKILQKYQHLLTAGSKIAVSRQYVVGEKNLELILGASDAALLPEYSDIPNQPSIDLLDLLNSPTPGILLYETSAQARQLLQDLQAELPQLQQFSQDFGVNAKKWYQQLIGELPVAKLQDFKGQLLALTKNLNSMGYELGRLAASLNQRQRLVKFVDNVQELSATGNAYSAPVLARLLPLMDDMQLATGNLNKLNAKLQTMLPAIQAAEPQLLELSERANNAMREAIITMQAMQQSFLLKKHADKIKRQSPVPK